MARGLVQHIFAALTVAGMTLFPIAPTAATLHSAESNGGVCS